LQQNDHIFGRVVAGRVVGKGSDGKPRLPNTGARAVRQLLINGTLVICLLVLQDRQTRRISG
jgi:hypothetical protein